MAGQVRAAFYDLLRNNDELRLHDEQIALAEQAVASARIKYTVGRVPQQDVLKAQVGLTKLAEHLAMFLQDGDLARARLRLRECLRGFTELLPAAFRLEEESRI